MLPPILAVNASASLRARRRAASAVSVLRFNSVGSLLNNCSSWFFAVIPFTPPSSDFFSRAVLSCSSRWISDWTAAKASSAGFMMAACAFLSSSSPLKRLHMSLTVNSSPFLSHLAR
eukprot:Lithocolla_globosa_v1_NODE_10673_length_578_cov_86.516588.p2 type:complete len:117 gc:universal NODE_10673_length_578_cov_86.516588:166-516(+)